MSVHNTCSGDPDCRDCEAIARVVEEMTAGDELVDVIATLDADDMAKWEVAVLRWYRGDKNALEAMRPFFDDAIAERAREYLSKPARWAA